MILKTAIPINKRSQSIFRQFVGESKLNPFLTYSDMKKFCPIQVIDLRFQLDHISAKKLKCLKNIEPHQVMLDYLFY